MLEHDILQVASGSPVRHKMLREMDIPFVAIGHTSDEQVDVPTHNFDRYVLHIAQDKMKRAKIPSPLAYDAPYLFVLAADSLVYVDAAHGRQVLGKPKDYEQAGDYLRLMATHDAVANTACCLAQYEARDEQWHLVDEAMWVAKAMVRFVVPEDDFQTYFDHTPNMLDIASGCTLEGFGQRYVAHLEGDYTAALGLPAHQLYLRLKEMGFRFSP